MSGLKTASKRCKPSVLSCAPPTAPSSCTRLKSEITRRSELHSPKKQSTAPCDPGRCGAGVGTVTRYDLRLGRVVIAIGASSPSGLDNHIVLCVYCPCSSS